MSEYFNNPISSKILQNELPDYRKPAEFARKAICQMIGLVDNLVRQQMQEILQNELQDYSSATQFIRNLTSEITGRVDYFVQMQSPEVMISFFETSLRDGAQSPGNAFTDQEKIIYTEELIKALFDFIEVGFPAAHGDATGQIVDHVVERGLGHISKIVALCRLNAGDIEKAKLALDALPDGQGVIHCFIATSKVHREYKLKGKPINSIIDDISKLFATINKDEPGKYKIMFSLEDATNTPDKDLRCVIEAAVQNGADFINIPDTIGSAQVREVGDLIERVCNFVNIAKRKFSIDRDVVVHYHGHNDLGHAVSASLEAMLAGAGGLQGTTSGMGERAGNTNLTTLMSNMLARPDIYGKYHFKVKAEELYRITADMDDSLGTYYAERMKKGFIHTSGIHQANLGNQIVRTISNPDEVIKIGNMVLFIDKIQKEIIVELVLEIFTYP